MATTRTSISSIQSMGDGVGTVCVVRAVRDVEHARFRKYAAIVLVLLGPRLLYVQCCTACCRMPKYACSKKKTRYQRTK